MPQDISYNLPEVTIVGRNDGRGAGILWDHLTIHSMIKCQTRVAHNEAMAIEKVSQKLLETKPSFKQNAQFLKAGDYGQGLLVIAGRSRCVREKHQAAHQARLAFEQEIIKDALVRKRPILAICGGSWSLWEALGGGYELCRVNGHDYGVSHPEDDIYLDPDETVHSNVQVHDIQLAPDSLLAKAMSGHEDKAPFRLPVNSIHGFVVNESCKPAEVTISARAVGNLKDVEAMALGTVEAFETTKGSKAIGVQFHPEAYQKGDASYHYMQRLLEYMVNEGKVFDNRLIKKSKSPVAQSQFFKKTVEESKGDSETKVLEKEVPQMDPQVVVRR
jgi:gamma-glutamyl-gamma-aminobutyrate hydrolase PuuD